MVERTESLYWKYVGTFGHVTSAWHLYPQNQLTLWGRWAQLGRGLMRKLPRQFWAAHGAVTLGLEVLFCVKCLRVHVYVCTRACACTFLFMCVFICLLSIELIYKQTHTCKAPYIHLLTVPCNAAFRPGVLSQQ